MSKKPADTYRLIYTFTCTSWEERVELILRKKTLKGTSSQLLFLGKISQIIFTKRFDWFLVLIGLLSVSIRILIPPNINFNTPHDDLLGIQIAKSLLNGDWLGPWDNRTLSKPPMYSIFLAICKLLHLDAVLFTHLIYLATSLFFSLTLSQFDTLSSQIWNRRIVFLLLAFNPAIFAGQFSRIYRTSLYTVLALLFVTLTFRLFTEIYKITKFKYQEKGQYRLYILCLLLGFTYSLMVLTRVEAYWILIFPAISTIFLLLSFIRKQYGNKKVVKRVVSHFSLAGLIFFSAWQIPISIVGTMNNSYYGVNAIENLYTGNFARTMKLWASVDEGRSPNKSISISKYQRLAVYRLSPTAKNLSPFLETPPNTGWKSQNCQATGVCDESGIWFIYELRDAAIQANPITSEKNFQDYFQKLADEISDLCYSRKLRCSNPALSPGMQPLELIPKLQILDISARAFMSLLNLDQVSDTSRRNIGEDPNQVMLWKSVISFKPIQTLAGSGDWETLGSGLVLLKELYRPILSIGLVFLLFTLLNPRKVPELTVWRLTTLTSIFVYCGGLALQEISAGFRIAFTQYALPIQPVLLALIATTLLERNVRTS